MNAASLPSPSGIYLFWNGALVVPAGSSGPPALLPLPAERAAELLARWGGASDDVFEAPSLDQGPPIHAALLSAEGAGGALLPPGWEALPVRGALASGCPGPAPDDADTLRMLRAFHLAVWRGESRFCGACGAPNKDSLSEYARVCTACGRLEFPRISPAVIILITNERDQILLAHNKSFAGGIYSLIAGFCEAGETAESAARREIREEAGLEVEELRYVRSQPWPFPNSLMLGFRAKCPRGEPRPDGVELDDARWFSRDALPSLPGASSIARALIGEWLASPQPQK
ncbi:MAG: NAD(+) diphosphatase [Treponema sp.]|jgi:NAD+ diphosphatase|nr:NAD(+) diphosphatase [Treponema sp.]